MTAPASGRLASLRDALLITAATYVTTVMGLVVSTIIARSLGPEDYGRYSYLIWMSGLLVVFCNHGLGISGIRFVSEYLGRGQQQIARQIHGWLNKWQQISTLLILLVFTIASWWLPMAGWEHHRTLLLSILIIGVASKAAYLFDVSIAKGHKKFSVEALTNTVMSLVYAAGVGLLALGKADLNDYAIFFGAVSFLHICMVWWLMRKNGISPDYTPCPPDLIQHIKPHIAWTVVLVAVATLSNKTIETFLLGTQVGAKEVGYFTIATTLTRGGIDLLSSSLTAMLMPIMAHAYGAGGSEKVNTILSDSIRYFLFFGLIIGGAGLIWSEPGIAILYGSQYQAVTPVLQVMVVVGGLTLPEGAFGALMSTTDNQKLRAGIATLSVLISAIAAFVLVPKFGLTGALVSHASTRVIIFLVTAIWIRKSLNVTFPISHIVRLCLAAMIAGTACWLLMPHHPAVLTQIGIGFVYIFILLGGTIVLKAWKAKDADMALMLAAKKPRLFGPITPWLTRWAGSLN
ncbi:oligosaccharide flippase family protein [Aquabacterium sp.]|uniref:lipopolysaccharide biosynthesis protein n=1 Tax=Aquabacterium sp. TaxID=1872578 RepID=UPI002489D0D3|nr:oligosaccharide flippase family protein [Aquabacterium sp.]MDI1261169.1 oligosaccharide flippase family protein [Aquabacterium sp.]